MASEHEGFLGRWARRKAEVRSGQPLADPSTAAAPMVVEGEPTASPLGHAVPPATTGVAASDDDVAATPAVSSTAGDAPPAVDPPPPTLDDVRALTAQSDFRPFMAQGVTPEVKNAAMKKLFTDPHYNVMDGLDIYIDDYSKADPIPEAMLRNLVSAKVLKLFETNEDAAETLPHAAPDGRGSASPTPPHRPQLGDDAHDPGPESVAQSYESTNIAPPQVSPGDSSTEPPRSDTHADAPHHAHTDLRLQQDDAARAPSVGRRAE